MDILVLSELCLTLNRSILDLNLDASFIQNGGHSLSAAALAFSCRTRGCHITTKAVLTSNSIRELIKLVQPTTIDQLDPSTNSVAEVLVVASRNDHQDSLCESAQPHPEKHVFLRQVSPSNRSSTMSISDNIKSIEVLHSHSTPLIALSPEVRSEQTSPSSISSLDNQDSQEALTDMQLALIHGSMKTPGTNIIAYSETYYTKNIPEVKLAWKAIIEMEPIFDSSALGQFRPENCERFSWHEELSLRSEEETRKAIELLRNTSQIGSVFRVFPQKPTYEQESLSTVTWIVHHAFVDGYSACLILDKLRRIMSGMTVKPSPPLSQLSSELQELRKSRRKEGNAYWARILELHDSASGQPLLPPILDDFSKGLCDEIVIDVKALRDSLYTVAGEMNVTPATLFTAAWALVLSKYVDSDTIMFGVVLSGRNLPLVGVKDTIGPLINTLPLYLKIDPELSASAFVSSIMEAMIELGEYQWTTPENGFSQDFETAVAVQFGQLEPPKGSVRPIGETCTQQATEIPLSIVVEPHGNARLVYHCQRYGKVDMERTGACYHQALQLLLCKNISIRSILHGILPLSSRELLFKYGNCDSNRTTKSSITLDLVTLFERSADENPEALAVERGNESLTYKDLDWAASRLAQHLYETIRPGDIVCVHSDRSINWIVAIFGILKAGGTYCSLDSSLPPELRNTMFLSSGAGTFILPYGTQQRFCPASCSHSIALKELLDESEATEGSVLNHRNLPRPFSAAYLCFTSGSTGTPKGVICTHGGLVAFQSELEVRLFAGPGIKISQVMSPAFDGSIHEIFSALCYGATLVLPTKDDPFGHLDSADSAILTPSIARVLDPESYQRLSNVSFDLL